MEILLSDRTPDGGICENTEITITVKVLRRFSALVRLLLRRDGGSDEFIEMEWVSFENGYDVFKISLALAPGLYWYTFDLWDYGIYTEKMWQLTVYEKGFTTPDWIKGGIIYHIFVDRFNRLGDTPVKDYAVMHENLQDIPIYAPDENGIVQNTDFYGGNLNGIREKIPYLASLGVTALYLSPIFEARSNHKYDTGDYSKIDPMFGSEEDFIALINECDKSGIKIICDGVFNHTGDDSLYFNKYGNYSSIGAYQSEDSPYRSWYKFGTNTDDYASWWGIKILPCTDKENSGFTDYITGEGGIIEKWTKMGVSWRLDVADELPDSFLDKIRSSAKAGNPDCLIIGEVWEDASNKISYGYRRRYLQGRQLDSVMNYPLKNAIINYVISKNTDMLTDTLLTQYANYPHEVLHCLMNILGTHDTPRILTVLSAVPLPGNKHEMADFHLSPELVSAAKERLKIASLLQMTLPGVPCIYYGDEAGMQGCTDPFNRMYFPWGSEDKELTDWYKKLSAIRHKFSAFKKGDLKILQSENGIFIFSRNGEITIAINLSDSQYSFSPAENILSGKIIQTLEPGEYGIFKSEVF